MRKPFFLTYTLYFTLSHFLIGDIANVTDGIHTSIDYDESSDINLISATSPRFNFFDLSRQVHISKEAHENNPRTALKLNDIILSTVGTIGNCAVVDDSILPANSDRHVGIIRIYSNVHPYFLSTFLLTKYGRAQTMREITGNVQPNLFLYKIREIIVPNFIECFQDCIQRIVVKANELLRVSKDNYIRAEKCLDKIFVYNESQENIAEKTLSLSFLSSGRLDAEYYQPKYELIEQSLNTNKTVNSLCELFDKNYEPQKNMEYSYIELANIGATGEIVGVETISSDELPSRARRLVKKGQVIASSIEGSLDSCALITDEFDNALCSTGFYVLSSNKINSETLFMLFKSKMIQQLLKQRCSGTILTAISKEEFLQMPLPYIDEGTQKEIAEKVQESFKLREQSKRLLDNAIKAVEMAIEIDEESALLWLEMQN